MAKKKREHIVFDKMTSTSGRAEADGKILH